MEVGPGCWGQSIQHTAQRFLGLMGGGHLALPRAMGLAFFRVGALLLIGGQRISSLLHDTAKFLPGCFQKVYICTKLERV